MVKVNLYADAGVRFGVATWATVALRDGEESPLFEASGTLRDKTVCSATAELRAIANALHKLQRREIVQAGDVVRVFTDSQTAVDRLTGRARKKPNGDPAKAAAVIHEIAKAHAIKVEPTWIRGHRPNGSTPHARWNNRCDELCTLARSPQAAKPRKITAAPPKVSRARRALEIARKLEGRG